ncbi:MAG: hypothetical protein ABIG44_14885 [Planctomycetota bacterium]
MRKILLTAVMLVIAATSAQADMDLLWDNYLYPGDGYDHVTALSSERNTFVTNSWTGDDAVFEESVFIQQIKWIGMLIDHPDADYWSADVVIYPANPDPTGYPIDPVNYPAVAEWNELAYSRTDIAEEFGLQVYEGSIDLPEDVLLAPGHYYYAVRLVGNNRGQNYIASTSTAGGETAGMTMGVFQSTFFHYPPHTGNWVYVDQATEPVLTSDFAYQLYGYIPEPASFILLAMGAMMIRTRR